MLRVGLSGGIGSGKSTVSRRLVEHGAVLIDSDVLAREAVTAGSEGLALIRERFGDKVIGADGNLDRPALGRVVFGDDDARQDLNAIVHPRVHALTQERMERAPSDAVVVHDIPLLVELDRAADYHLVLIVGAEEEVRLRRLVEDRGMSEDDARARIAAQATDEQRRAAADVWLPNGADLASVHAAVDTLWSHRLVPFEANLRSSTTTTRDSKVLLVAPDPSWPTTAARLLARIQLQVGSAGLADRVTGGQHIGSTAVPGLPAKDVIDLQLTVDDLRVATSPEFENALLAAGFAPTAGRLRGSSGEIVDSVHAFAPDPAEWVKVTYGGCDPGRVVHLHVRRTGSAAAEVAVQFRDWLRAHPHQRDAYAAMKRRVAADHPGGTEETRGDYPTAKEPWFATHLPRARAWATEHGGQAPGGG